MAYDIFISYKRKSLATANNLYYRLTTRGYSAFFDLEEMRRNNFNEQLFDYIENAKDVFVILEEGSLDSCKDNSWKEDWFCKEIAHALKNEKNIIPILLGGYKMPKQDSLPTELKELSLKNALEFSFSYFEEYLDKLIRKGYIISTAEVKNQVASIFKFYSNQNCQVFKEGKLVCSLESNSDEPYYLPVQRKGDYRFKCVNTITNESKILKEHIDENEEKDVDIEWAITQHVNCQSDSVHKKLQEANDCQITPVLNGPESFIFGDILEVKVNKPLKNAVWEIYCGAECLYKSNIIQTNRVIKLYENTEKIRFIMNGHVSKVEKYKTKQLTIHYSHCDNPSICAKLSIDKFSSYENKAYGNIKSSSVDLKVDGMSSNNLSKPILIGPEKKCFIYYETILINVQNPVKNAVWEILVDDCCAYKSNSTYPAWGKKVFLKEFDSIEKIRFKIARDIGDGYSYSANKVLIRYYQSDNPNILAELTLSALNKY